MSWPDWFGFPISNSVDWEMRERQRGMGWQVERKNKTKDESMNREKERNTK